MVIWPGAGPGYQCLWSPASLPAAGARRRVGPADWSGTEPTGRPHRLGDLSVAGYYCLASDDEGFVEVSVATVPSPCGLSL